MRQDLRIPLQHEPRALRTWQWLLLTLAAFLMGYILGHLI